jgi:hypothetical protein
METEALMPCKLIILYILDKVDFPMPNVKLTDFITQSELADYFSLQQSLTDLKEIDYVNSTVISGNTCYKITPAGGESLSFFTDRIPLSQREIIDKYIKENKYQLKNEANVQADVISTEHGDYLTRLRVMERGSAIIEINLIAATENEAKLICSNWKKKSSDIYAGIFTNLISDE